VTAYSGSASAILEIASLRRDDGGKAAGD